MVKIRGKISFIHPFPKLLSLPLTLSPLSANPSPHELSSKKLFAEAYTQNGGTRPAVIPSKPTHPQQGSRSKRCLSNLGKPTPNVGPGVAKLTVGETVVMVPNPTPGPVTVKLPRSTNEDEIVVVA